MSYNYFVIIFFTCITISQPSLAGTITSLTPATGSASGGTTITILGSGFKSGARVYIGTESAPSTFVNTGKVTFNLPAFPDVTEPKLVAVKVLNPDGTFGYKGSAFTYLPAIGISNLVPSKDANNLYYKFNYTGDPVRFTLWLDTDLDASSGLQVQTLGADYMVENSKLYKHIGPGWVWELQKTVPISNSNGIYNVTLAKTDLESPKVLNVMAQVAKPVASTSVVKQTIVALLPGPTFPRLGGVMMGGKDDFTDPAFQRKIAQLDMTIFSYWPGWGNTMTMEEVARAVKSHNPNIKMFLYANVMAMHKKNAEPGATLYEEYHKLDTMKWFAYEKGTLGLPVPVKFSPDIYSTNITRFAGKDSSGKTWAQFHAKFIADNWGKPNPSIDGIFEDNVFWKPRVYADWNRDGVTDDKEDPVVQTWWREGMKHYFESMRVTMPGKLQIGNIADLGAAWKKTTLPEYEQVFDGGMIESLLSNDPSSPEMHGDWAFMMKHYKGNMDRSRAPKLVMFDQKGLATDYQFMRYGLASCMLGDGYFLYRIEGVGYNGIYWFDEFNHDLGKPIEPAFPEEDYQSGVYRRDFEHGIVLVNPKGNGAHRVILEKPYRKISGTQAPAVNNGALVHYVDLKDRDGIVLLRE